MKLRIPSVLLFGFVALLLLFVMHSKFLRERQFGQEVFFRQVRAVVHQSFFFVVLLVETVVRCYL